MTNYNTSEANINQATEIWQYGGWMATNDRGDYYSSIKRQDNAERASVVSGQWSVYDTYFHHYLTDWMSSDGSNNYFNNDKLYVTRTNHKT